MAAAQAREQPECQPTLRMLLLPPATKEVSNKTRHTFSDLVLQPKTLNPNP